MAGEIIWFKIYNAEANTNRAISYSKVAYLEIVNNENTPVLQTKVELKEGHGSGSLYLPVTLTSGGYTLRCYTSWMKNFDPSYYFHKDLAVFNSIKAEETLAAADEKKYAVQFFPEGGNLVMGMKSKIAFKAVDNVGKKFNFRGSIIGISGDTVARFSPAKDGIGTFYFKPAQLQAYKVSITPVNEKSFLVQFPEVFERGTVMLTTMGADSVLNISVQSNLESEGNYTLFVHSGHRTVFTKSLSAQSISEGFKVPFKLLGDGISHFTLFNSKQQALCERLYFKKPSKVAKIEVLPDKKDYYTREKVGISVLETAGGKPLNTNFSIAVYKADSIVVQDEDIVTNLWLTSELKGRISNASSYLKNYSEEAIDNLMLTHGWSRFKWEDVLQAKKTEYKFFSEPDGHIISGRIINKDTKEPLAGRDAFLSIPDRRIQIYTAYSNQAGEINFFTKNFNSTSGIIAQVDPRKDSLARIEISSPFSTAFSNYKAEQFNFRNYGETLQQRSVAMQVNNAFNSKQLNREFLPDVDSSAFYLKPEKVYKLDNYVRFKTMEEVLREYVSEITVSLRKKDYHLSVFDIERNIFHSGAPLILVDGVPVFDEGNTIIKFEPLKVKQLEVVTSGYGYGNNIFSGIASFRSYKGDLGGLELPLSATVLDYSGLQNKREFYSPMYDGDVAAFSRLPDYRTTLFWSADNETNTDGKASINFFTSDLPGKYYVVVQSLSKDGYSGSKMIDFNVNKKTISQIGEKRE